MHDLIKLHDFQSYGLNKVYELMNYDYEFDYGFMHVS